MSSIIKILPDQLVNKIAAGEVVDRPASVVKELMENAVDALATEIHVDVEQAGKRLIRVIDNGIGMSPEDARIAFFRHATSKITSEADLEGINTMGFRGEALASIASVSQVRLITRLRGSLAGFLLEIDGGAVKAGAEAAAPEGASIEINHLFFNTPARLKFLKSASTEFSHIVSAVSHLAAAYPAIKFKLTHNRKSVLDLPASSCIQERIFQIYGSEVADGLMFFSEDGDGIALHGLLSAPAQTRADRTFQDFYVNKRYIRNLSLSHAVYSAYSDMLMRDRHPLCFLFLDIDPGFVDVNVHPAKAEVRFRNQSQIHDWVRSAIRSALRGTGYGQHVSYQNGVREAMSGYLNSSDRVIPETLERKIYPSTEQGQSYASVQTTFEAALKNLSSEATTLDPGQAFLSSLGQIHDSFIVAQSAEGMVLIDQHAAHERVLFEKLQDQFQAGSLPSQALLLPVQVELAPAERELFEEHKDELFHLGFDVEHFGGTTCMIKAVPALMTGGDYKQLLTDMLDELKVHGRTGGMLKQRDEILSVMACHPAIKVNRGLDAKEMESLMSDLSKCRMPHTCPHGRPTLITFSLTDIKKLFKRV